MDILVHTEARPHLTPQTKPLSKWTDALNVRAETRKYTHIFMQLATSEGPKSATKGAKTELMWPKGPCEGAQTAPQGHSRDVHLPRPKRVRDVKTQPERQTAPFQR